MNSTSDYAWRLARQLHAQGRHDDAESAYRVALREQPDQVELHLGLAECLLDQGRRSAALDAFVAATISVPHSAEAHFGLGECEFHPLRRAEAFATAIRLDPNHGRAHLGYGEALCSLGNPEAAIDVFKRGRLLAPGDLELARQAGDHLVQHDECKEAVAFLETAIAEHPIDEESTLSLGHVYRCLARALAGVGRHAEATEAFRSATYLLPDPDATTDPALPVLVTDAFESGASASDLFGEPTWPNAETTSPDARVSVFGLEMAADLSDASIPVLAPL